MSGRRKRDDLEDAELDAEMAAAMFGTTCIDCGEPIDDVRPYGHTLSGELIHFDCGDPMADEDDVS